MENAFVSVNLSDDDLMIIDQLRDISDKEPNPERFPDLPTMSTHLTTFGMVCGFGCRVCALELG